MIVEDLGKLPKNLPAPIDDGAANHLKGIIVPAISLTSTANRPVDLGGVSEFSRIVVYCYPRTGKPGEEPLNGYAAWNRIPSARGCTPQTCAFRDLYG